MIAKGSVNTGKGALILERDALTLERDAKHRTDLFEKFVIFGGTRMNSHYGFKEGVPRGTKKLIRKKSVGGFERKWLSKNF